MQDIGNEIYNAFKEYNADLNVRIRKVCRKHSKTLATMISDNSPVGDKNVKHYKDGWTSSKDTDSEFDTSYTVHNKIRPYVGHLLEYGHLKRDGTRYTGYPHIQKCVDKVTAEYEAEVEKVVEGYNP